MFRSLPALVHLVPCETAPEAGRPGARHPVADIWFDLVQCIAVDPQCVLDLLGLKFMHTLLCTCAALQNRI